MPLHGRRHGRARLCERCSGRQGGSALFRKDDRQTGSLSAFRCDQSIVSITPAPSAPADELAACVLGAVRLRGGNRAIGLSRPLWAPGGCGNLAKLALTSFAAFVLVGKHSDQMTKPVKIGLVQMSMTADPAENAARAERAIEQAVAQGARVVCLPELFLTPYFCQVESAEAFDLAEPIPGPTTERFGRVAQRLDAALVVPLFERRAAGVYHNSAVVIDRQGRIAGHYRKMHIPDDPAYYEKYYFTPGDLGFAAVAVEGLRIGVLICWDQWFPEAARLTAAAGADLLFYPTAIGWHPDERDEQGDEQRDAWMTVQRGHAVANGVFVAAVNRVGIELPPQGSGRGLQFWGSSFAAGPLGAIIAQAPTDAEAVVVVEIDPGRVESVRRGWPFWRDRRIDAYGPITRRWGDGPATG